MSLHPSQQTSALCFSAQCAINFMVMQMVVVMLIVTVMVIFTVLMMTAIKIRSVVLFLVAAYTTCRFACNSVCLP